MSLLQFNSKLFRVTFPELEQKYFEYIELIITDVGFKARTHRVDFTNRKKYFAVDFSRKATLEKLLLIPRSDFGETLLEEISHGYFKTFVLPNTLGFTELETEK